MGFGGSAGAGRGAEGRVGATLLSSASRDSVLLLNGGEWAYLNLRRSKECAIADRSVLRIGRATSEPYDAQSAIPRHEVVSASHLEIFLGDFSGSQQKKPAGYSQAELQSTIYRMKVSLQILEQKSLSLNGKINHLKKSSSNDPVQQLQTDMIVDMYQIVREMQVFLNPLLNLYPSNPFE
jgi:hypothetical protein